MFGHTLKKIKKIISIIVLLCMLMVTSFVVLATSEYHIHKHDEGKLDCPICIRMEKAQLMMKQLVQSILTVAVMILLLPELILNLQMASEIIKVDSLVLLKVRIND